MIAAIYARKSTEQAGVADEQRSVARQIEHATQYAHGKGWTVDDACVFVDDGISGAEFTNRPGYLRLLNTLKPRPPFQVLIMSEVSRLGREQIETAYALKQLSTAGVRCFGYLDDRELLMESATDKFLLSAVNFAAELEREKARHRTYDAMRRKAEQRQVTGGQCFGYHNVDVIASGVDGRPRRQYVRREIVEVEASIVRRIFELCAQGNGLKAITKALNDERVAAPRSQRGRPRAWAPSSVRSILHRETYRGVLVWNKSKKRNSWGQKRQTGRPSGEWIRTPAEDLRIVSETLWQAAHGRLTERRENYQRWNRGDVRYKPVHTGGYQPYLLSGFARCAVCGGSMQAVSRSSTPKPRRVFRYVCGNYINRGTAVCGNARMAGMDTADAAIRQILANEVVRPGVLERALDRAVAALSSDRRGADLRARRSGLTKQLAAIDQALANLTDTAARCGAVPAVLEGLHQKDQERRAIAGELQALRDDTSVAGARMDAHVLRKQLRAYLKDWRDLTVRHVTETRGLIETVLRGRIAFAPVADADGTPQYELTIPLALDRLIVAAVPSLAAGLRRVGLASPTGFEPVFWP